MRTLGPVFLAEGSLVFGSGPPRRRERDDLPARKGLLHLDGHLPWKPDRDQSGTLLLSPSNVELNDRPEQLPW